MNEMLKRVMDAIAPGCHGEHCNEEDRYEIEMMARRAIAAMREPTGEMLESCGNGECAKWAPGAWLNMIDAALEPSKDSLGTEQV